MQSKIRPIFQKLSNFLKVSIFLAKMKRPIIPKLLFLKESSTPENLELLHHYNYGFAREFQFSPSATPPFRFYRDSRRRRLRRRDVCSVLFFGKCVGRFGDEKGGDVDGDYRVEEAEALPAIEGPFLEGLDLSDEDDSIDRRAEIFIQKFYADMKLESLASI